MSGHQKDHDDPSGTRLGLRRRGFTLALVGVLAAGVAIQFVPVTRTNPPVTREIRWNSNATRQLARQSCYDCHSNETRWPWYAHVAPMSWLVASDVAEGRRHLNFSTWAAPNEEADKILEMVREGRMPLWKYVVMHPEAGLDTAARDALVEGLRATLEADPPVPGPADEADHH